MTHDEFAALVARLEPQARRDPAAYRRRVIALAFAGYGYLMAVLALLVGLFVAALLSVIYLKALGVKLALVVGAFLYVVVKALWVRLPNPTGFEVARAEAPALFALIDGLRDQLQSKRFHHVLITNDFNAGVVQVPRLGALGWHRNYLLIGLPLMKGLTPAQLKAVLAHEFGHLAGGHGRISNWIYRLRLSYHRLLGVLEAQQRFGTFLFKPFFSRYAPYFNAYSFPLARANEHEADAAAARLVSPRTMAEALTGVEVIGSYLDNRFWPAIHRKADELPTPEFAPLSFMSERLATEVGDSDAEAWLKEAMARETNVDNTHPSLADRLKALGEEPRRVPPAQGEAADRLLGPMLERITGSFDASWKDGITASWEERHRVVRESKARLAELDARAASEELPVGDGVERARLTDEFGAGADAALEQFRALHARDPANAAVNYSLGMRLLARDDEAGIALMQRAIELDPHAAVPGYQVLRDYCWRTGRKDEAKAWHAKVLDASEVAERVHKEGGVIRLKDKIAPHGLSEEQIDDLRRQLRAIPRLRRAYLVRKVIKEAPEEILLVIGFTFTPWYRAFHEKAALEIRNAIARDVAFPYPALVICTESAHEPYRAKFKKVAGSRIL